MTVSCPLVTKSIAATENEILQMDQFMFDVIDLVAQGHRCIPVAGSVQHPTTVTHVITDLDVAKFLRLNAQEVLGGLAHVAVEECGLMKRPLALRSDLNYGSALHLMAARNLDMAIVLDEDGKIGARISTDTIFALWLSWKQQSHRGGMPPSLEMMKKSYEDGSHVMFNGIAKSYSIFSTLLSPLKHCESVGITVVNFASSTRVADQSQKQAGAIAEEEEGSDDSINTDTSDSDSDSDSPRSACCYHMPAMTKSN